MVVDDDHPQVDSRLAQYRPEALLEILFLVPSRDDHRECGIAHGRIRSWSVPRHPLKHDSKTHQDQHVHQGDEQTEDHTWIAQNSLAYPAVQPPSTVRM